MGYCHSKIETQVSKPISYDISLWLVIECHSPRYQKDLLAFTNGQKIRCLLLCCPFLANVDRTLSIFRKSLDSYFLISKINYATQGWDFILQQNPFCPAAALPVVSIAGTGTSTLTPSPLPPTLLAYSAFASFAFAPINYPPVRSQLLCPSHFMLISSTSTFPPRPSASSLRSSVRFVYLPACPLHLLPHLACLLCPVSGGRDRGAPTTPCRFQAITANHRRRFIDRFTKGRIPAPGPDLRLELIYAAQHRYSNTLTMIYSSEN